MGLAGVYVQAVLLVWAGVFFFVCVYVKSAAFSSIVMDNDWDTGGTVQSYCIKFLGQ